MNMNKKTIAAAIMAILLSGLFITGCKQKNVAITDNENKIKFDSILVNEKYYLLGDTTNPFCTLESSFVFPSDYKDINILNKLNAHFISSLFGDDSIFITPKEAVNNYAQRYIADYKELEADFRTEMEATGEKPSQESWFAYFESSSNEIIYNKHDILSYSVSIEYYTGGAHGGHGYNNHVIDLKTGNKLEEQDIFINNYHDELAKIIVSIITSDNNLSDPEELEGMGFFNIQEIYPNNNFYVNEDGITYTFNEYEIAAYFVGKTDVLISYDRLETILRKDSPIAPLIPAKNEPGN